MKRKIEIFTAGCPVCEPVVEIVKDMVCDSCEVIIHNLSAQCESKNCIDKINEYSIASLPAVVVNGVLLNCCKNRGVNKDELIAAGIGKAS